MKRILLVMFSILFVVTGIVSYPANRASACSCVGGSAKDKLERSTVVFEGKVIKKGKTRQSQFGGLREYTFDVDKAWKGVQSSKVTIYSYDGSEASCGLQFNKGQSYLVYSYLDKDNSLQTNYCSGNIPISQAGDEINQLGLGTTVNKNAEIQTESNQGPSYIVVVSVGIIIMLTITIFGIWRIKKRNKFS
ncbi:hypothetical protein [Cohnella endophytica]|nr:hypothetical protein [Cohnella endophytica]